MRRMGWVGCGVALLSGVVGSQGRPAVKPGETRTVTFELTPEDMQLLNAQRRWVVEPGAFEVQVGSSSADIRLKQRFEIVQ